LKFLPNEIGNLKNLEMLQLKYNWLDSLPDSLGNCVQLKFLYLNRNNLSELPESLGNIAGLKEVYVAGAGQVVLIPESFCDLRLLEVLEIDLRTVVPMCLYVKQTNRLTIIQK
jgi:Leucine-rich repeat (LRR) protein